MNDIQKRIIAKKIYDNYCVKCERREGVCCLSAVQRYSKYRDKGFTREETRDRRCFQFISKNETERRKDAYE